MQSRVVVVGACLLLALLCINAQQAPQITQQFPANCASVSCQIADKAWPGTSTVLIQTNNGKIYVSNNEGIKWSSFVLNMNVALMIPSMNNPDLSAPGIVYFLPVTGRNFTYTADGAQTLKAGNQLPVPRGQISQFLPHPTQAGWIMCTGGTSAVNSPLTLYVSKNFGGNWTASFKSDIGEMVMWGNNTQDPDQIFVQRRDWSFGYTSDYGNSFNTLLTDTANFQRTTHYMFVGVIQGGSVQLYVDSQRRDATLTNKGEYKVAEFPLGDELTESYYMLDDTTRAEYIGLHASNVNNPSQTIPYGDIYASEFDGDFYRFSARHVFYANGFDFIRFHGLGGIYLANIVTNFASTTSYGLRTTMTYNNGGDWAFVIPPSQDMNGNPFPCPPSTWGCSLNLHGHTGFYDPDPQWNPYPAWKTHSSAIGLIIANGNVGTSLTMDPALVSTFFSRNAGATWAQIAPFPTVFEWGDHGSVLVMAPSTTPTTYVNVSYDQALSFQQVTFPNGANIFVNGISAQPNGTGLRFIITGTNVTSEPNGTAIFYIFGLDLTGQQPPCQPTDLEQFVPVNPYNSSECFMGATTTYTRRKQASKCFNTQMTDIPVSVSPCPCTMADYECEWNYISNITYTPGSNPNPTLLGCNLDPAAPAFTCSPGQKYWETQGYALVPDTQCNPSAPGALNLLGTEKSCPHNSHPGEVAAAVIVTLLIVGSVVALGVLYWKNDRFRNWVQSKLPGRKHEYSSINQESAGLLS